MKKSVLQDAIDGAPKLPECAHGVPLCDWGGELTYPSCGCSIEGQPIEKRKAWAVIMLGLHLNT